MHPHFHKVPLGLQNSFCIRHDVLYSISTIWHYHPELELHYTIKGEGERFIGDNISNFSEEDMLLLGENLPHTWRCSDQYFQESNEGFEAIVMHFLPTCLGNDFLSLPEASMIPKLFEKAKKGMIIYGETKSKIKNHLLNATGVTQLERLVTLLSILKLLAETEEYKPIVATYSFTQTNTSETNRLNEIFDYTLANYKKQISLKEIASMSNLNETSFCRYFKLMTKKTYLDFLNEIRISHACRMIIENRKSLQMICFDSGFNNISNFYRHFKKFVTLTPLQYKNKYLQDLNIM